MDSERRIWSPRAQSSVIGVILIIGLTLAAASAVVVFGSSAIDDGRQHSQVGQAEQAMTQFDSRAAQVALGESDVQTVQFGQGGGDYQINETAGSVKVYHEDYNDANETEVVFTEHDLGVLRYESGETTIAYQGGGVWRSDGDGASVMVSPPEFHYRTATLTFPIIRVTGDGAASGRVSARITNDGGSEQIYPDATQPYGDGSQHYLNPVEEGNMTVEIQSQYCEGWRSYFASRTEGVIEDYCSKNDTVRAELATLGTQGEFSVMKGNTVRIRGKEEGHSIEDFDLKFVEEDEGGGNSQFANFGWWLQGSDNDGNTIGIYLEGGGKPCANNPGDTSVRTVIYYDNASSEDYGAFVIESGDSDAFNTTCQDDHAVLNVNLLDDTRNATYTTIDGDDPFDPDGSLHSEEEFEGHSAVPEEPISFTDGEEANLDLVVQHYFAKLGKTPNLDTFERQGGNNQASLDSGSSGNLKYKGSGQVVTFLHITDNELQIELE